MEQNKEKFNLILRTILTSLIAGSLFYLFFFFSIYFHFISENIVMAIPLFNKIEEISSLILKTFLYLFLILCLSVFTSLIYYTFLRRFANIWISVSFGLFLFLIFFLLLIWVDKEVVISSHNQRSLVTIASLFVLYGLFTGYSISFDYRETNKINIEIKNE